ncbi:MAG: 3-octaprenyl-4-hydroxybenzoate carboxy-lyase [Epsilonproteobacteria bacterium]|nr:MAG: 3-octaprenyl-4-hydroxybenzoate carboxy-lyase [Campylobacterota bacterium]
MKIVVAITGASGSKLGFKFIEFVAKQHKVFVVISKSALNTISYEHNKSLPNSENITYYDDNMLEACISSGSFKADCMAVLPCSMNSMAKFTIGLADTLIPRVFSVMLKENRNILIAPREMPYNQIQLKNMLKLSKLGIIVAPPVMGYYSKQSTINDMENFLVGRWCDMLNIENSLYKRWHENDTNKLQS